MHPIPPVPSAGARAPESTPDRLTRSLASGPIEICARGDAMAPLVQPGDRVRLARRAPRSGEVGLISVGGRLVLHRLVRRRGDTWLIHADRPGTPDAWVHVRQVIAIATDRLRAGEERWTALGRERGLGRALRNALLGASPVR
jgi:hypothetical protein